MARRILSWSSLFFFLLSALVSGQIDDHGDHPINGPITSHADSFMVFFKIEDLRVGKRMPIFFPDQFTSKSPPFMSPEEANIITPFSPSDLPRLLHMFSIPPDSPRAEGVKFTLERCYVQPFQGEKKTCATSMASMLDFVHDTLGGGPKNRPRLLTSIRYRREQQYEHDQQLVQNYTILERPVGLLSPHGGVACHTLPFPYKVFYCHQMRGTRVFTATLGGENGDVVEAVAVCHMDTSGWSLNHPSFLVLGIGPGTDPVCHWFREDNLIWVPSL